MSVNCKIIYVYVVRLSLIIATLQVTLSHACHQLCTCVADMSGVEDSDAVSSTSDEYILAPVQVWLFHFLFPCI